MPPKVWYDSLTADERAAWRKSCAPPRLPVAERFWRHVDKSGECWIWIGSRSRQGYGSFAIDRGGSRWRTEAAHRVAYELAHGDPVPTGVLVRHRCDNPACVRPGHLELGDHRDNAADRDLRGRGIKGRPKVGRVTRGEASGMAKVTTPDVLEIRRLYAAGGISQQALAERFGIDQTQVSRIVLRKVWAHLP